ncbi:hypothetical protein NVP2275O_254 [Vibrio phage 2.275.O._10N.286.54.E11]|nr:hypothetical protein NVP2275O_254 [Vibrio phage 2.275.O._10N.286.54.E11]
MATGNYIPEKFYVGRQSRGQNSIVGFMTPITKDSAFSGRKATVNKWSDDNLPKLEIENKSQKGFRVVDNVSRHSTSNVLWRVLHPRGFEIEISSGNFMHLIQECKIDEGEFENSLLFVRCGKENYLTFEGSSVHAEAHAVADIDNKVPIKNVQIGDSILLKDGTDAIYYGSAHFVTVSPYRTNELGNSARRHVYKVTRSDGSISYVARSSLHISKVQNKVQTPIDKQVAFDHLEDIFKNPVKNVSFDMYDYNDIVGIFQKPLKELDMVYKTRTITKAEYKSAIARRSGEWRYVMMVGSDRYRKYSGRRYHYSQSKRPVSTATSIECVKILGDGNTTPWRIEEETVTNSGTWHTHTYNEEVEYQIEPTDVTSYEVIEIERK